MERGASDRLLRGLFALVWTAAAAFLPFFVLWLRGRGFDPAETGVVLSASALVGVIAAPIWSDIADRRAGTVRTLQVAFVAAGVVALALALTGSSLLAVVGVAAALSAAQSPQSPLTDALAMRTLGPARLTGYGSFRQWASLGWGVGSILFGALFQAAGLGWMLPVYAAGVLAAAVYVGWFPRTPPPAAATERASRFGAVGEALSTVPRFPWFLAGVFVFGASTRASWDYVPLRIAAGGGGAFLVGVASGVSAFVEIPFMRWSGGLMRRFGMRGVFAAGGAVYVLASIGWALVSSPVGVTAIRIAIGIGFGLTYVTLVVMTGTFVPERLRNTGQTLLTVCSFGLSPIFGSLIGGFVYQHAGPTRLFLGSAVGIVVAIAIVWTATRGLTLAGAEDADEMLGGPTLADPSTG
ncbi:MAG TPA: MFS transporter [Actinomycetota bacterium]|nr:MFS transporter [Actinomycetota bacterium]